MGICENRNIAAVADEKDEKFRQMGQRFKKLEEEEKAKAKVHQDLTTSLMNVQDDIEKKLANNDLTIKAKLEEILQKDQKIASLEKQVEDLQKEKTMFQTGKKRHLNGQDVYCQGSQGFLKPTHIWKNNFQ